MVKSVQVHLTYQNDTSIMNCLKNELMNKIQERYSLNPNEIELFSVKKNQRTKISLDDIQPGAVLKIEIRTSAPMKMDENLIIEKINRASNLTAMEKKLCIRALQSALSNGSKRKLSAHNTSNKKIQVNSEDIIRHKTISTQTENFEKGMPSSSKGSVKDFIIKGKMLAVEDKPNPIQCKKVMEETFDERRNYIIVQQPCIRSVKDKYPLLFTLPGVQNEIDRLFIQGKCNEMLTNIGKYADCILSMTLESDCLVLKTKEKASVCKTSTENDYALCVGSILVLSSLMMEERNFLALKDSPVRDKGDNYPYILATEIGLNELFFKGHKYQIIAEDVVICETNDFKEAIICLLGVYFIFNINYSDKNSRTLFAMERLYLEHNETKETDVYINQVIRTLDCKAMSGRYKQLG